jgi:L-amino acid N-acyltransferase YncA
MMDELTRAYSRQDDHQVIQMRDQNRRLVGWSLLLPPGASSNPVTQVQIYVRARDRRRGVGRRLLRRAMRIAGNVEVCPWDHTSAAFYGPYIDRRRVKCASGYFA